MKEEIKKYIAYELKSLRARNNITIVELCEKIGMNKDTMSRYENALSPINIDILEKILNYYNTDFDIFFKDVCANKHKMQNEIKEE